MMIPAMIKERQTAVDTGVIMFLLGTSGLLAWVLSRSQAPRAGVDPIHFGIIMVVNLQLGVLSPPVAASAVVTSRIAGISFEKQTNALWPFMGLGVVTLILVTYIPPLSLWMPRLFSQ